MNSKSYRNEHTQPDRDNGLVSKEGITRDLEAMAEAGISEAFIGAIYEVNLPRGITWAGND